MDEFTNRLDPHKFRATNAVWNNLRLNDPWSVGYVSTLIESAAFAAKEEWEEFYYRSGAERDRLLAAQPAAIQQLLNNFMLKLENPRAIEQLDWNLKKLNFNYGRTREQLAAKGEVLYRHMRGKSDIDLEECAEAVRFRTICETWNGIVIREKNTVASLAKLLPGVEFRKVDGAFDHRYAVDFELYKNGGAICGIQIKPESYAKDAPYIIKARMANQKKNAAYRQIFRRNVCTIIARQNGAVVNTQVLQTLRAALADGKIPE